MQTSRGLNCWNTAHYRLTHCQIFVKLDRCFGAKRQQPLNQGGFFRVSCAHTVCGDQLTQYLAIGQISFSLTHVPKLPGNTRR